MADVAFRFEFDVGKLTDVMIFLGDHVKRLGTLKAAKLLYLADREHLLRHGRPILGDWYACMPQGPAPAKSLDYLRALRDEDPISSLPGLRVVRRHLCTLGVGKKATFIKRRTRRLDDLSSSELDVLRDVVAQFGRMSTDDLIEETHKHTAWKVCDEQGRHIIPYRLFLEDAVDREAAQSLLVRMDADQEDRDFFEALGRSA